MIIFGCHVRGKEEAEKNLTWNFITTGDINDVYDVIGEFPRIISYERGLIWKGGL